VYSAFGFKLPRNSSTQQAAAGNVRFFSGSYRIMKINRVLDRTKAGSIIFFPGHIMLYLGKVANKHYAIHALLKCKKSGGRGKYEEYYPKQVIISALEDLERIKNGTSFIASLVSVTTIE
jgi:hypothetical protein